MNDSRSEWAKRIMIALDYAHPGEAQSLLDELKGIPCYMKVGMQLFYTAGPMFVKQLKEQGYHVFLDLKLHDIPNTVKGAAASITRLGVDMFNVHAAGGFEMMQAALQGVQEATSSMNIEPPHVIAVTQLTSTSQQVLNDEIGIPGTVEEAVMHYALLAQKAGLDGVVASPLEVARIKNQCGSSFLTVTPGIRPKGVAKGDQIRVMTPEQALREGSDYLVIGRPVTQAPNPRQALETIMEELSQI